MALFGLLARLLNDLIRAGRSQAGNNAHGQGGQGISGGKIRHVDVHGGQAQQAAKGADKNKAIAARKEAEQRLFGEFLTWYNAQKDQQK